MLALGWDFFGISNPDPEFLFWARSKNPENPWDRDRDFKTSKTPGDQDWDLKIPKKSRENSRAFSLSGYPGDFFLSPGSGFVSWDGISR